MGVTSKIVQKILKAESRDKILKALRIKQVYDIETGQLLKEEVVRVVEVPVSPLRRLAEVLVRLSEEGGEEKRTGGGYSS